MWGTFLDILFHLILTTLWKLGWLIHFTNKETKGLWRLSSLSKAKWKPGMRLDWVAIPFSRGSFLSRDQTQVSWFAGRFFTIWATKEDLTF